MNGNKKRIAVLIAKIIKDFDVVKNFSEDSMEFKIVVQKLGYLIQKVGGLDYGFKFEWLSRGPYSKGLQNYYHHVFQHLGDVQDIELDESEDIAIRKVENMLLDAKHEIGQLDHRVLELVASLIMLCTDVYPAPDNVVDEFSRKKNVSMDIVERLLNIVKRYGFCI
ncbi:hypothetical protein QPL79_00190 [Ignisphaera sp. 4213-co]|mgnify:CR=1 FL=1|uniref:Uncharacterized protein n=1 Tax=Ignisphaera cupida TaxID=3050454 RepID=A0ABD4Z4E8_9CREN|nr:hypothetical protein [Ignisphaera sp. 4213-co]MDK6027793.1 hypothetical protein [Ignisphaera sp. 4213-co]